MKLSLKQSNAVQALAQALYSFLPGSGARQWGGHVTFGTIAERAGVGEFWPTIGSKHPRIVALIERTLMERPKQFEPLMLAIVREGLRYRAGKGEPVTAEEVGLINAHLLDVGFKFPDLWDEGFVNALKVDSVERARANVAADVRDTESRTSDRERQLRTLAGLRTDLESLFAESNRQLAGIALEKLLNTLFSLYGLAPRAPFRVVGEQIDGSFELDRNVYLLEAKWEKEPMPEKELLVFRGKIEGKSSFTRGLFFAMNGVTRDAETAIRVGKQPTFFVMTGHDLMMVLQGAMALDEFLRRRVRLLAEEAAVVATFDRVAR